MRLFKQLAAIAICVCTITPSIAADFAAVEPGHRLTFPQDTGAHPAFRTEWWYYTGQVTTKDGRPFGYELTFFRRGMPREQTKTLPSKWAVSHLYLAHFAISDLSKGRFHYTDRMSRAALGKAGAAQDRLHAYRTSVGDGDPRPPRRPRRYGRVPPR